MSTQRLVKDENNAVFAGCLAGIANYLDSDPALVRIAFCLFSLFTGFFPGILIYIILMVCMPSPEDVE